MAVEPKLLVEYQDAGRLVVDEGVASRVADAPATCGAERGPNVGKQRKLVFSERPIGGFAVGLDPAPAAVAVTTGDGGGVSDADRSQHLIPPW
jgi:hypothetical protein